MRWDVKYKYQNWNFVSGRGQNSRRTYDVDRPAMRGHNSGSYIWHLQFVFFKPFFYFRLWLFYSSVNHKNKRMEQPRVMQCFKEFHGKYCVLLSNSWNIASIEYDWLFLIHVFLLFTELFIVVKYDVFHIHDISVLTKPRLERF